MWWRSSGLIRLRIVGILAGIVIGCAGAPKLESQSASPLDQLATLTAQRVAKLGAGPVLVAPLDGCLLDSRLCSVSDSLLRAQLEAQIPNVKIIDNDTVARELISRGLLPIDAYHLLVIQGLANQMNVHVLVLEYLYWDAKKKQYTLNNAVFDGRTLQRQVLLKTAVDLNVQDEPVVFRDPQSGASLIVINKKTSGFLAFRLPQCERCSVPLNSVPRVAMPPIQQSELLAMTITETGTVSSVGCFSDDPSCKDAVKFVSAWRFKPALDSNGRAFAVRTYVAVNLNGRGDADRSFIPAWQNDSW